MCMTSTWCIENTRVATVGIGVFGMGPNLGKTQLDGFAVIDKAPRLGICKPSKHCRWTKNDQVNPNINY